MRAFLLGLFWAACTALAGAGEGVHIDRAKTPGNIVVAVEVRAPFSKPTGDDKADQSEFILRGYLAALKELQGHCERLLMMKRLAEYQAKLKANQKKAGKRLDKEAPKVLPKVEIKKESPAKRGDPAPKAKTGAWMKLKRRAWELARAFHSTTGAKWARANPLPCAPVFVMESPEQLGEVLALPARTFGGVVAARLHIRSGTIYLGRPEHAAEDFFYEAGKWYFGPRQAACFARYCLKGDA